MHKARQWPKLLLSTHLIAVVVVVLFARLIWVLFICQKKTEESHCNRLRDCCFVAAEGEIAKLRCHTLWVDSFCEFSLFLSRFPRFFVRLDQMVTDRKVSRNQCRCRRCRSVVFIARHGIAQTILSFFPDVTDLLVVVMADVVICRGLAFFPPALGGH